MKRTSYWAAQVGHLQRRAHTGFTVAELMADIEQINRGLHQLLGDIEREIYGDGHDRAEASDNGRGSGEEDRQHHPVVPSMASD